MAELATVARPYAQAAFGLAVENASLQTWSDMLAVIEVAVGTNEMVARIGDPNIDEDALESFLLGAIGERLEGHGRSLLQLLVRNRRLPLVRQVREMYEALRRDHEGTVEARVISAKPIAEEQVRPLLEALEKKYGRKVSAQVEVDPELIGGARIVIGDKVIDATVRGRLDALAAALTH